MSDEFARIARFFAPLAAGFPGAYGLTDDAAAFTLAPGEQAIVTTDALVAGVHFIGDEPPELIARKALRTNLSDLAAMGAQPLGYTLAAVLPRTVDEAWLASFTAGLAADQAEFGITLLGGDTVATSGPLTLSITAIGRARGAVLRRAGARPGDLVCVSGTIGDAALGLAALQGRLASALDAAERAFLIDRYRLPQPRLALGQALVGLATAALDISDGLVGDLGHIATASGVGARLEHGRIPISAAAARVSEEEVLPAILSGGDDYELLFTVPQEKHDNMVKLASDLGTAITVIGEILSGNGVVVQGRDGRDMTPKVSGYRHF